MNELRQRKLKDDTSSYINQSRGRSIKPPRRLKKIFILLIVLAICGIYILGMLTGKDQFLDGIAKNLGYKSDYHYAVIIDAGSSGSRVLAYEFRVPFTLFGPNSLDLENEHFEQSKPGLSSYADDPAAGAETIVQLIKSAEFLIPMEKRKHTPLIVRATAGLRLLPKEKAKQLIDGVAKAISGLGYDVATNGVEIMEGSDEGIFIWYTVNLLHDLLLSDATMAALDLGGGSTQITYQLNENDAKSVPVTDQYIVPAGTNLTLFTHSYLNLGLLAARYGVFRMENGGNESAVSFTSVCVDPIVQREPWVYANKQYLVSGGHRADGMKRDVVYRRCHDTVRKYALATMDWEPNAPRARVAAMSYFYDVAADAGLIDVMKGGVVTIKQYRASAVKACSASNVEQPWACIDLVYMVVLLQDCYKIRDNEPISLYKKVNGHEVSWALGLAYTTVMNRMAVAA